MTEQAQPVETEAPKTGRQNTAPITKDVIDVQDFNERIVEAYNDGSAEMGLPADHSTARSLIPAGTGSLRDFSYIAPEIPIFNHENCVACMDCVTECPDTAILGKAVPKAKFEAELGKIEDETEREMVKSHLQAEGEEKKGGQEEEAKHHSERGDLHAILRDRHSVRTTDGRCMCPAVPSHA